MFGSGRQALPYVREWSGGPPGCPGMVGMPSRMSGSGQEAFSDFRDWSGGLRGDVAGPHGGLEVPPGGLGGPPGGPGVVGKPSRMSGSGREALPDVRWWSGGPLGCP